MTQPGWARWSARGAVVFFAAFSLFQAALALGAPMGALAWGGSSPVAPSPLRAGSAAAAVILAIAAAVMLARAGDVGRRLPPTVLWWLNALLAALLALNTLANLASRSPGERLVMGSATVVGMLLCVAALFGRVDGRAAAR